MKIENHMLVSEGLVDLTFRAAPNRKFALSPKRICIHYDVCHGMQMNTDAQFASGLFYHVAVEGVDSDGMRAEVRQYVPFNLQGSHAKGFNADTIGIVIVNPGPLIEGEDGKFRTTYGKEWPIVDVFSGVHPHPSAPKHWTHWAAFSHEERDAVLEICTALIEHYPTIHTICGHDHLSPGRKFDPGPAAETTIMATLRGAFPQVFVSEMAA